MSQLGVFANPQALIRGWYWALPSAQLSPGGKCELKLFGDVMVLFRSLDGQVVAVEAYCPHMGAHLADGTVEAGGIRCGFHGWKFDAAGRCIETPCKPALQKAGVRALRTFRVAEKFGMIWLHTDSQSTEPLPSFFGLKTDDVIVKVDIAETRRCHPTLILGGWCG